MTDYPLPESPNRAHVRRNDIHGHDGENFCDGPIYPAAELRALGADIRFGRLVAQFAEKPDGVDCILDDGERIAADIAIVSTGVRPRSELAKACDLAIGPRGI